MVSRWEQPSTCYLAIKLEKFTKCPAGQIVKYKLNDKKTKYDSECLLRIEGFIYTVNVKSIRAVLNFN